jgi:hypothetical protein
MILMLEANDMTEKEETNLTTKQMAGRPETVQGRHCCGDSERAGVRGRHHRQPSLPGIYYRSTENSAILSQEN